MYSRMTGKAKVVVAVLGLVLSALGLRAEGFDIFYYKNQTRGFSELCEHIAGLAWLNGVAIINHWNHAPADSSYTGVLYGKRHGEMWKYEGELISLSEDGKVGVKVAQAITPETVGAENIRKYLEFFCSPRFARVFFPKKMLERLPGRPSRGRLCCDVTQKKLKKGSPAFVDFGKYTLILVRYEEMLSGCFFEIIYCFKADGSFAGWYPTRLMAEWMARIREGKIPNEEERLEACQEFSNFGYEVSHTLGIKDFE